jgi:hypothetical protein
MTMSSDSEARFERLERVMTRVLAGQAARRAPATLSDRVMAELARRAALPWWRRGFADWPLAARIALVLALGSLLWLVLTLPGGAAADAGAALRGEVASTLAGWSAALHALGAVADELRALLSRAVPATWVYGIAAVIAALYASFFGLGAATYKLLQTRA